MARILAMTAIVLLICADPCRADFTLGHDPGAFFSNDIAPWQTVVGSRYPTQNGLGIFSWDFQTVSVPFNQSLVGTLAGGLFVGVSSSGTGQDASYTVMADLQFGNTRVMGIGFYIDQLSPGVQLSVYDSQGKSASFTIPASQSQFVDITSDTDITRFAFTEAVTNSTATLRVSEVFLDVAVPAPPAIFAAITAVAIVGGVRQRNLRNK